MASALRNIIAIVMLTYTFVLADELSDYQAIVQAYRLNTSNKRELVKRFFLQYPTSSYIPDIRMLQAASLTNVDDCIAEYQKIIRNYRYYKKRDEAYFLLCQLYYIKSDWENLLSTSNQAIVELSTSSSNYLPLLFQFRAIAQYSHAQYEEGASNCDKIPEYSHEMNILAFALFLKAEHKRQMYGYSRAYIQDIAELLQGYKDSAVYPSVVLQAGQFYEHSKMYNEAWSAYTYLINNYPKSPEAVKAYKLAENIKKFNPVNVSFIPDEKMIAQSTGIDISPHIEEKNTMHQTGIYYTISIGPLYNLQKAKELQKLIVEYVMPVHIVRKAKSFEIYAGHFENIDDSMNAKIRLAEELGINGFITQILKEDGKQYIYGQ